MRTFWAAVGPTLLLAAAPAGGATVTIETIAVSGMTAPGTPAGTTFRAFDTPTVSISGDVAFAADFEVAGTYSGSGVWSTSSNGVVLVIRTDDPAPSMPGLTVSVHPSLGWTGAPMLDDAGSLAFSAYLKGTSSAHTVTYRGRAGALVPLAVVGEAAPGTTGAGFSHLVGDGLTPAGVVLAWGDLQGSGIDFPTGGGYWLGGPGALTLVARAGDPAPGIPGATFVRNSGGRPDVFPLSNFSNSGAALFLATVKGTGIAAGNNVGIWVGRSAGDLTLMLRVGDAAPGVPGAQLESFASADLDSAGRTAVLGRIRSATITDSRSEGIWIGSQPGSFRLHVRAGDEAPGLPPGVFFSDLYPPKLTESGDLVFKADLAGTGIDQGNRETLWIGSGERSRLVARAADPIPGHPGSSFSFLSFDRHAVNVLGQILMEVNESSAGLRRKAYYVLAPSGELARIAAVGDSLEVMPGVNEIIADLDADFASRTFRLIRSGFGAGGHVAFVAHFANGGSALLRATVDGFLPVPGDGTADGGAGDGADAGRPEAGGAGCGCSVSSPDGTGLLFVALLAAIAGTARCGRRRRPDATRTARGCRR